ncbi:unnamed protein product [Larinioides sclopetarius]|uniref:Uncharacterized protein n=1 Tax=Larinioides sclopetarius TaxID=280406 RepID=A0AAV1ZS03_9ARAC
MKGLLPSGCDSTGGEINILFNDSNAFLSGSPQVHVLFFFVRSLRGLAISEK